MFCSILEVVELYSLLVICQLWSQLCLRLFAVDWTSSKGFWRSCLKPNISLPLSLVGLRAARAQPEPNWLVFSVYYVCVFIGKMGKIALSVFFCSSILHTLAHWNSLVLLSSLNHR